MQMSFRSAFNTLKDNEVNKINLLYIPYVPIYQGIIGTRSLNYSLQYQGKNERKFGTLAIFLKRILSDER